MQPPSIHVDLRCDPGVVEAADRMLDRLDSVTDEPPGLHPGAIALVERRAPQWSAERTVSETVVRARLDLARLAASRTGRG
ncbi:MAG: hypothetical protein GEU88_13660 [Solirubrobacterales bacterium]|nr:hypothetical protein [Solirubrobacterales bacterium]